MGLVTEVVPAGRHLDRALEIAEALARFPQDTMLADRARRDRGVRPDRSRRGCALEAAAQRSDPRRPPGPAPPASPAARAAAARAPGV